MKPCERGAVVAPGRRERLGDPRLAGLRAGRRAAPGGPLPASLFVVTPASLANLGRLAIVCRVR